MRQHDDNALLKEWQDALNRAQPDAQDEGSYRSVYFLVGQGNEWVG